MLENAKESFRHIFEYIGERLTYGGILYNCFMGKDRTGVLSALLLMLCEVSEDDILADYMISVIYLKSLAEKLGLSDESISSRPEYMKEFLVYLNQHYTNAEQYLLSIGVLKETIYIIKDKFICNI
jgi:protein tyrosine/serine phosphatase